MKKAFVTIMAALVLPMAASAATTITDPIKPVPQKTVLKASQTGQCGTGVYKKPCRQANGRLHH